MTPSSRHTGPGAGQAAGDGAPSRRSARRSARPSRSRWRRIGRWALLCALALVGLGLAAFIVLWLTVDVPEPNEGVEAETSIVYYGDGEREIGRFAAENRISVPLSEMPEDLQRAVVAAEDRSFFDNRGISLRGIVRSITNNVRGGDTQGGSTITQQLVKNYYLTADETYRRKLQEIVLALKIDAQLSKDQILEDYLNTIYFGRSSHGVQTASRAYFGVDVADLDFAQSVTLAAILRSPGRYDPHLDDDNAERLAARVRYVVEGMEEAGWAPAGAAQTAEPAEIREWRKPNAFSGTKGYLLDTVRRELVAAGFDEAQIDAGGLRVVTTFEQQAQRSAVRAVLDNFPTQDADGVHAGLAAVRPGTGEVVAMYGGRDYLDRQQNDATESAPQAGSTVKAFTVATALQNDISLQSGFAGNSPLDVPGSPPVSNEFDQDYGYRVSLLRATEQSVNTAFVDLTMQVGADEVLDTMVDAGIPPSCESDGETEGQRPDPCTPGLRPDARITLGTAAVTPMQLANGFATLAAEGRRADWHTVSEVRSAAGALLYSWQGEATEAIDADVANETTYALSRVVSSGTGRNATALGRPAAGKTGTAEDVSAWFVGYTPQLAAAVGFYREDEDGRLQSLDGVGGMPTFFGGEYPTRIWTAFMDGALDGLDVEQFPDRPHIGDTRDPVPTVEPRQRPRRPAAPAAPTRTPAPQRTARPTATAQPTAQPPAETPEPPGDDGEQEEEGGGAGPGDAQPGGATREDAKPSAAQRGAG